SPWAPTVLSAALKLPQSGSEPEALWVVPGRAEWKPGSPRTVPPGYLMSWHCASSRTLIGYNDGTVKVWNAESGACIHTLGGHTDCVPHVHLHEQRAASCSYDRTIRVWDIEAGQCLHTLLGHEDDVTWVWYNGRRLLSEDLSHIVKMWDPETETCLRSVCLDTGALAMLQFDGKHIVSLLHPDRTIGVWDGETLKRTHTLTGNEPYASMTLKNSILGVVNFDGTAEIWNVETGQRLNLLQDPDGFNIQSKCLALRGDFLIGKAASCSSDRTIRVWDIEAGQCLHTLLGHEASVIAPCHAFLCLPPGTFILQP
uniref:Uncharacterized protein n=1 Tax=Xenopus tropicalis TaxID=8364 RepID=A0A6I8Q746_XENTR